MDQFDLLRREATKLERNLEDKIARYHSLSQKIKVVDTPLTHRTKGISSTSPSLLESVESGNAPDNEAALANEINRTLSQLNELINTQMAPAAERSNSAQHSLLVKRYREILFDSTNDFKKVSSAIHRSRESMELFSGANISVDSASEDPAMEQLLRERNAIGNSLNSAASILAQAGDIRSELRNQGAALRGVGNKVLLIMGNIPGLNGVIDNIRRRRGKDDMIVSGVIAFCILFTLWYIFG
jgi:golgi SNAP receptor complex member 1